MYCIECGKANPEGAKFCAFCGKKLFTGEPLPAQEPAVQIFAQEPTVCDVPEQPAQSGGERAAVQTAEPEPVKEPAPAPEEPKAPAAENTPAPEQRPYVRARQYRTLQPLMENPAQPGREVKEPVQQIVPEPAAQEAEPQETLPDAAEPEIEDWWNEPKREDERAPQPITPPEDLWADAEEEAEEEDLWADEGEPEAKKKFVFPWQKNKDENLVLTSTGTEEMPARKPVIARKKRDTRIPERIVKQEEPEEEITADEEEEAQDIFFMRPKRPSRRDEDEIDDAYVNSRVRTILFAIAFVACLFSAVWLFATNSGQMFLAGFNLSTDAEAYRDLGDSALANNQVKRAAEAYYRALSLDPDDYETALLVGKTQQQIGEYDTAADAYYMCTQLNPSAAEPYEALVLLYKSQGEPEKAEYFQDLGEINAGLSSH